jgi:DNA-binding ferritin-like protein
MISIKEKTALKKIFGKSYVSNVQEILANNKVKNNAGESHSAEMIRQVFNGHREHIEIEEAIIEAADLEKKRQKQLKRIKSRILKSA